MTDFQTTMRLGFARDFQIPIILFSREFQIPKAMELEFLEFQELPIPIPLRS